jgi:hypothetical protein
MNGRAAAARALTAGLATAILTTIAACGAPTGTPAANDTEAPEAPEPTIRLVTTSGQATSGPADTEPPTTLQPSSVATDSDAAIEELAAAWLVAYRTASFTGAADAWIDHTAPYVTDDLRQQNDQLRRNGRGPGVAWHDFADHLCTARVIGVAAVIPPEAPRTDDTVHIQTAGTLRTTCANGTEPPDEALAVTLTAVRTDAGWRIASRDY